MRKEEEEEEQEQEEEKEEEAAVLRALISQIQPTTHLAQSVLLENYQMEWIYMHSSKALPYWQCHSRLGVWVGEDAGPAAGDVWRSVDLFINFFELMLLCGLHSALPIKGFSGFLF